MKIRIGIGAAPTTLEALHEVAQAVSSGGFDSIWLPEVLASPVLDPVVALAVLAATAPRLKLGTTVLFTGTNTIRLAKRLASLDVVSGGRLLVTAVPGLTTGTEPSAIGLDPRNAGPVLEEVLGVLRQLWSGASVTHDGPAGTFTNVTVRPTPVQHPLEVWLGGTASNSLLRCGRVGDGWLPSLCTPEEVASGRVVIEREAALHGRAISEEHFGVSLGYFAHGYPEGLEDSMASRLKGRVLADVIPSTLDEVPVLLERFIAEGCSKFVLRPLDGGVDYAEAFSALSPFVVGLQT